MIEGRRFGFKSLLKMSLAAALLMIPAVPIKAYVDNARETYQQQENREIEEIKY